jgi:hypothetical protein
MHVALSIHARSMIINHEFSIITLGCIEVNNSNHVLIRVIYIYNNSTNNKFRLFDAKPTNGQEHGPNYYT